MADHSTNFALSLEQLTGMREDDQKDGPTALVAAIRIAWKKPLNALSDEEIGRLVVQHYGYPYLLDLVMPKLEANPLFDGGYYPGDILSNLIRANPEIWTDRPMYREKLRDLYLRAIDISGSEGAAFRESLNLPDKRPAAFDPT